MFQMYFCNLKDLENNRWDTNYWRNDLLVITNQIDNFRIPIKEIGDIGYVSIGQSGKRTFVEEEEVQYLIVGNLLYSGVDFEKRKRFVGAGSFNDPERSRLQELDILMAISGNGSIGKVSIALDVERETNISQDMALIRLENNQFSTLLFLQSKWGQAQIKRLENGTGVTHLNQNEVKGIKVPLFPITMEEWCKEKWLSLHELHKEYIHSKSKVLLERIERKRLRFVEEFERRTNPYIRKNNQKEGFG